MFVRYGTEPERERARLLRHSARTVTRKLWAKEKELLERREPTVNKWNLRESKQILSSGSADGWEVVYKNSPQLFPQLANDLENAVFVKAGKKHSRH